MAMRFPHVMQHDSSDCAAACVASVCSFYGKEITIVKLRELLGTDLAGTTVRGIVSAADKLGFEARAVRVDPDSFRERFTLPAIARIAHKDGTAHFVVVYSIKGGRVRYMDPAEERLKKRTVEEFHEDFDGVIVMMVPNENFTSSKEGARSVLSSFITLLKPHWKMFVVAIAASVVMTLFGISLSIFNKVLIDEIIPYNLNNQLFIFSIILVAITLTQVILSSFRQHLILYLSQKINIPLMLGYFQHIFRLPMGFFASRKTGDILTRFQDAGVVQSILTGVALSVVIDVAMVAIVGVLLYTMNATLFGIVLVMTVISALLIFVFRGPYKRLNKKSMEQGARLNSQIIESLNGIEVVKTNSSEDYVMERIETEFIKSLRIGFGGGVLSNIQGTLSSIAGGLGSLGMMVIGGYMVINGETTLGTIMAFSSLAGFFTGPIGRLISLQLSIQEANISLTRLSEIYDIEEEEDAESGKDPTVLNGGINEIAIEGVTFRYGSRPPTLKDVSIRVSKGEKIAIVGRSGCGKTTLSKLMLKFYVPEEGTVSINGTDVRDIDAFALRERIGCVSQSVQLFSGSIRDNIILGKPNATPGEISRACTLAGCDEFLRRLPAGLSTSLDEDGGGLSGGEKQRISIARAIVKGPELVILDEATSSMDFITEHEVYDAMFNRMGDATMVIIAHRLSTIRRCDRIYVMDKGEVVESGTHESLLESGGMYAHMWQSQVGDVPKRQKASNTELDDIGKVEGKEDSKGDEDDDIEYE